MFIVPSRGRPHNLRRLVSACVARGNSYSWTVRIDDNDARLDAYRAIRLPTNWSLVVGPQLSLSGLFNEIYEANPGLKFYGIMADDVVPGSIDWDIALVNAAGEDALSYGNDGINGETHWTHGVIGGDLARTLGWIHLPGVDRLYADTALEEYARAKGLLRYCPYVKLTHYHFSNGLAEYDETYQKPRAFADEATYREWREAQAW